MLSKKLIQYKYNANLYNNGLSKNGEFAVCQTGNSDNEDGNKLSFFDLDKRRLVWKIEPKPQWADNYGFDIEKEILSLYYEDGRTYRYGLLQVANLSTYSEFISMMKKALEKGVSEYYQSLIHRELGEVYQKIDAQSEAIHHFEKAISLNPKIGVKKMLKSLKGL